MKRLTVALLIIATVVAFGCKSTQTSTKGPTNEKVAVKSEIIDHQNRGLSDVPKWVTMDQGQIEDLPEFKNYFVFKESQQGKDINALKIWVNDFVTADQVAKLVSNRIQSKFAGAMVGSVDGADTYFEKIVKSMSEAKIAGWRRYAEYWVMRRYFSADGTPTKEVYEYFILIAIPKEEVKKAVARAFDQNQPKSENEKRARDQVKKIMDSDSDW